MRWKLFSTFHRFVEFSLPPVANIVPAGLKEVDQIYSESP